MENCLKLQLKRTVNNENLPFFDTIFIYCQPGDGVFLRIGAKQDDVCTASFMNNTGQTIRKYGGVYGATAKLPLDPGNNSAQWGIQTVISSSQERLLKIDNASKLTYIQNVAHTSLEQFSYSHDLRFITLQTYSSLEDYSVSGDISKLGNLTKLRALYLTIDTPTRPEGSLESFVEGLISNGIEDCTVMFKHSGKTTFNNGTPLNTRLYKLIFSSGTCEVYEDASTAGGGIDTLRGSYNGSTWTYNL